MKNIRVAVTALAVASATLVAALTREEGVRYVPYYDIVGVHTVCMGHTKRVENRRYSDDECKRYLRKDIEEHSAGALACIKVPISQTEYEAFASLAFNIGINAFCKSTLVKKLNAGDYAGACKEILRWNKQKELTGRRQREYQQCIIPVTEEIEVPHVVESIVAVSEDRGNWISNRVDELRDRVLGREGVGTGKSSAEGD